MTTPPLLDSLLRLAADWRSVFPQQRTFDRAKRLMLGQVLVPGLRTVSRVIAAGGRDQVDWSADYRVFSRSKWDKQNLFDVPIRASLPFFAQQDYIAVAGDFTHITKTGRKIPNVHTMRDPMSPAYHNNLIRGQRFIQLTMLLPLYHSGDRQGGQSVPPRSIPICFSEVPALAKPGKNATEQEKADYKAKQKKRPGNQQALENLKTVRRQIDEDGAKEKDLLVALDGGFCNRVFFGQDLDRIELIARMRKDASLCFGAAAGGRRFYAQETFTPESVRLDEEIPWQTDRFFNGGDWRNVEYKEIPDVFWRRGAQKKKLRLIVLRPTPYRTSPNGKIHYRQPAYIITSDLKRSAQAIIQCYLDRWQIEVNHREEKSGFGLGDAQVRNIASAPRLPVFVVAVYALLLLAAQQTYGSQRTDAYVPLPKWRKGSKRPSLQDIVNQLRREIDISPGELGDFDMKSGAMASAAFKSVA